MKRTQIKAASQPYVLGRAVRVSFRPRHHRCSRHDGQVEIIFDTGTRVYTSRELFEAVRGDLLIDDKTEFFA